MRHKALTNFSLFHTTFYKPNFKIAFLIFFLVSSYIIHAQTEIVDEKNFQKAIDYLTKNSDSSFYHIKKLKSSNNQCRALFAKVLEATLFYNNNEYEKSTDILESILNEVDINPRPETFVFSKLMVGKTYKACIQIIKLNVYRRFFNIRKNEKKLTEAYDYLVLMQKCIDHFPKGDIYYLKNKISIAYSMASLKKVLGKKEESLDILLKTNKEIDSLYVSKDHIWYNHFQKEKANINVQIGRIYMSLEKETPKLYGLAELHFDKASQIIQEIDSSNSKYKSSSFFRKAQLNYSRKKYNKALHLANNASKYYDGKNFNSGLYNLKAKIYSDIKDHDSAIYYSNKLIHSKRKGLKYGFAEVYGILAENHFALNKIDGAYKYSQLSLKTYNEQNLEKELASNVLNQNQLSQAIVLNDSIKERRKSLQLKLIITIIIFLLIIVIIIFNSYRKRKILKRKIEIFKNQLEILKTANSIKKEKTYTIDDETTKRILDGLTNIENSTIFTDKDFNLNFLAKLLNTNTSYLSRTINEYKKLTFKQYLIDLRITTLINKLDENPIMRKYSIEALAESIGYNNASSFTRIFKKYTGVSPSEYLKKKYTI